MGFFFLRNKAYDKLVVDFQNATDQPLIAYPQKTRAPDNQLVQFDVSETPPYFYIAVKMTGNVIDIEYPFKTDRPLISYRRKVSGTENQLWMLVPSDETEQYFFIESKLNVGVISLLGEPENDKTPLIVTERRTPAPAGSQLWSLVKV